jgi:hypothetical protein
MDSETKENKRKQREKFTTEEENINSPAKEASSKKMLIIGSAVLGIIPLVFLLYIVLGPAISILTKDISAQKMKIIAGEVNLRSEKSIKSFVLGKYTFGTDVLVYEVTNNWAEVTIGDRKGYMSVDFLADEKVYFIIEGLFGDNASRWKISRTKYRTALAAFIIDSGYITRMPEDIQREYFEDKEMEREVVQIISEPAGMRYNCFAYGDFDGDNHSDAAFVLRNLTRETNKMVIFSFNKANPISKRKVIFEMEFEEPYYYIRHGRRGTWWYLDKDDESEENKHRKRQKQKLLIDAVVIGTNRNISFNDQVTLLVYNGYEFEMHKQ